MTYARIASGFRPGGPNYARAPGVPEQFAADTTKNYELGIKGDLVERYLTIDASIYRIDWNNIQLQFFDPTVAPVSYILNGGSARSKGVELSVTSNPINGLSVSAWGAWNDATLQSVPPDTLPALPGDRLPYSSRFSGNATVEYQFPISGGLSGTSGVSATYVGDRLAGFALSGRINLPSYSLVSIHAGLRSSHGWDCSAFVTNLTDKRGFLDGDPSTGLLTIVKPRTIGISVDREF
jgi:outer membrane receptor protein involved in Fe transport